MVGTPEKKKTKCYGNPAIVEKTSKLAWLKPRAPRTFARRVQETQNGGKKRRSVQTRGERRDSLQSPSKLMESDYDTKAIFSSSPKLSSTQLGSWERRNNGVVVRRRTIVDRLISGIVRRGNSWGLKLVR